MQQCVSCYAVNTHPPRSSKWLASGVDDCIHVVGGSWQATRLLLPVLAVMRGGAGGTVSAS